MYKILLSALFVSIACIGYAQKLTFGHELSAYQKDDAIPKIAEVWKTYVESYHSNRLDSVRMDLWRDGSDDITKYWGRKIPIYMTNDQLTFNIRKLNDSIYEIHTISFFLPMSGQSEKMLDRIYKVCAEEINGEYKLLNYLDATEPTLGRYSNGYVDYYYPKSYDFNKNNAVQTAEFVRNFISEYNLPHEKPIRYIVANTLDESNEMLGFVYTMMRSEKKYAGHVIYPRTAVSARVDHIHELVHAVMIPLYPDTPLILHEGIATYYGGGSNKDYACHVANFKKYLKGDSIVDFTDEYSAYIQIEGDTSLSNTVGALIVEYILRNYGKEKLLEVFANSKNYEEVFSNLGVAENEINDFVIHKLVENYR